RPAAAWWEERAERERPDGGGSSSRWLDPELARGAPLLASEPAALADQEQAPVFRKRRIYPMGINRNRLEQAIHELGLPAIISRDERDADAVLVLKSMYRKQPDRVDAAQGAGLPVYVLRGASVERLREALADLFRPDVEQSRRAAFEQASEDD
ncbi:MAG TPA: hypothetical protein VE258_18675, partial [Ktedonobacterales bacterium]|nr:hypothetical protein [Ktedonobacterales bacterium]